jgi:hypothetical protein
MNIIQFALGQMGKRHLRQQAVELLLDESELPQGPWIVTANRSWRSGLVGRSTEISRNARRAGTFTALRRFRQETPDRYLFLEVMVLASAEDARLALPQLRERMVMHPGRTLLSERQVEGLEVPGVDRPWLYEMSVQPKAKKRSSEKLIGASISHVVFAVIASGFDDGWEWRDVTPVASAQAAKIRANVAS